MTAREGCEADFLPLIYGIPSLKQATREAGERRREEPETDQLIAHRPLAATGTALVLTQKSISSALVVF